MVERYSRATDLTAPRIAATTPCLAVEGYWIDSARFFFLAEKIDSSTSRIMTIPSIADCETKTIQPAIELESLAFVLSEYTGRRVSTEDLASANFYMPEAGFLETSINRRDYKI